jgi:hypothetical protein
VQGLQHEEAGVSAFSQARPSVSSCESYHLGPQSQPLYARRFDQVLPFHEPGLAPVSLNGLAWHIRLDGDDAYPARFERSFGFYCGVAAVRQAGGWFHIMPNGQALYAARYAFVGNFQGYCCVVCDAEGRYFHIDLQGRALYTSRWRYCGDFREGVAVVQGDDGLSTHISGSGEQLHSQWFADLDVYHKGFSRARDSLGWHHVGRTGQPIYAQRYAQVEPFYNGCSRVETQDGGLLVIDETGAVLRELRPARRDHFAELSADMVGYWRTFTLCTAAELGALDHLPATTSYLAKVLDANPLRLERLLCALAELDMVALEAGQWLVTAKGQYLCTSHAQTLQPAAIEYGGDLLDRWRVLPAIVRGEEVSQDVFTSVAADPLRRSRHHLMLASYAQHDYPAVVDLLGIQPGDVVFDAAGGSGTLSGLLAERYPAATIFCGDIGAVLTSVPGVQAIEFDLFKLWPIKPNKVVLARVLHDWDDEQVIEILRNVRACLLPHGEVLVLEMLQAENRFNGALCDLHLLAVTGGKERRLSEYEALFARTGFSLISTSSGPGLVRVLRAGIADE